MERVINVDLVDENIYEKYNKKVIAKDLINYIIDVVKDFEKDDTYKIIINNYLKVDGKNLIKKGLEKEYERSMRDYHQNNTIQFKYLILGVIALFISTLIHDTIFKEIVLIGGWVLIWSMVESEIFGDFSNIRKRRIIKKLLNSEIIENKI